MEHLLQLSTPLARSMSCLFHDSKKEKKKKNNSRVFNAKLEKDEDDQYYKAAIRRASLRFQETLRPDPLFTDPYIRCLLPPDIQTDASQTSHKHCLATKFIDDKLISIFQKIDGLRQVILLTDGMDTRPYRLNWPASTILFDVSPDRIFRMSVQKLEDVGAKIQKSCRILHVPSETCDIQQALCSKGFNGGRPSLCVLQGLPIMNLANFKDILAIVSNLTMKGCFFLGEVPCWLVESLETGVKSKEMEWMDKIFMSHSLRIEYDEVAINFRKELMSDDDYRNILFVAEQLRFSDDQIEIWRREFQRIEEDGNEQGFDEL